MVKHWLEAHLFHPFQFSVNLLNAFSGRFTKLSLKCKISDLELLPITSFLLYFLLLGLTCFLYIK